MRYVKGALAVLSLLAMIIFSLQNFEVINVAFLSWSMAIPKFMVIVGAYVLGMITGAWLFDFLKHLYASNQASTAN